ncbi:NADPH-dependent FMN reductase [Deinococcus psychrotolerans]|uniref:NADPH-dependent FMN reductase n=1 Tax=Deinococcus psychrotolerans TaxID=2489213 RepID=UPI00240515D0|nr:NAD(P)H-dependent oxidoreductase [Deinococcus psychrotolerans]
MAESVHALKDATQATDALLIATPEYNYSVPGGACALLHVRSMSDPHPNESGKAGRCSPLPCSTRDFRR